MMAFCVCNGGSDAPYVLDKAWVDNLVTEHQIDYIVHGDDPCIGVRVALACAVARVPHTLCAMCVR